MLLYLCLLAAATAAPASYDQRQTGDFNVQADLQNIVVLVAMPSKVPNLFDLFTRNNKPVKESELQDRADIQVMEAFVEPNQPYHVEIGSERSADGEGRAVEVVIAARRRSDPDSTQAEQDEYKLLGATEQCGPDRERDPVTLICKARLDKPTATAEKQKEDKIESPEDKTPEVIPA